jgi:hypothetical protein
MPVWLVVSRLKQGLPGMASSIVLTAMSKIPGSRGERCFVSVQEKYIAYQEPENRGLNKRGAF